MIMARFWMKVLLVGILGGSVAIAQQEKTVNVALQATGTFSWVVHAMEYFGIDKEMGLDIQAETYATKPATEIALRSGKADILVDDFVGVTAMRENNVPVVGVYPYSLATGGVVVPTDSDIKSIADLKGKTIGATGLDDKSLLILRALTLSKYDFDPQVDGETLAVAPPLMEELLAKGELDAALPYWHYVARMVATGQYKDLMETSAMLDELGLGTDLPLLIVVAREDMDADTLKTFLQAFVKTIDEMKTDDGVWQSILDNELYSLPDPSLFPSVRERWLKGIPQAWDQETIDGLVKLTEDLVKVGGADVVGVEKINADSFTTEYAPQ